MLPGTTASTYSTWLDGTVVNDVPYFYRIRRMPGDFGEASCLSDSVDCDGYCAAHPALVEIIAVGVRIARDAQ